ncbi:diguanylate cyclase domain-containing protein [Acinetobacter sp. YH12052]|uniref:diguanylate cyclase domain-containing protein n=1 Tax=Acinetobacter sp. YH12052 TaxID=2601055 RepID=UPI0015D173F5|nr:sensor domain-containing diguanylate cyclase [Acinetobacter sp. YH12052]
MKQLYNPITLHQLFTRSQLTIFALTFTICSAIFLVISTYTMHTYAKNSLTILSNAINERVQPAVVFNDQTTMRQILNEYTQLYPIRSIETTNHQNASLAHAEQQEISTFSSQAILDYLFFSQPIRLDIHHDQKSYGELVVYGNSSDLVSFFHKILLGLFLGFILLLATVFWSVNSVYQYLMQSVRSIVESAQTISIKKDYKMRVSNSDIQELHALSTAFNGLLSEIEQSNKNLISENDKLIHLARHDALTQLPNRNYFYEKLFELFDLKANTAVFFVDIENFKHVNDQYGHLAGDAVLRASSHCLKQALPDNAFVARLGGDEFAIIINHLNFLTELEVFCHKIHECYGSTFVYEQHNIALQANIGVALIQNAKSPEDLIADADRAMYDAKLSNNHWCIAPQRPNS